MTGKNAPSRFDEMTGPWVLSQMVLVLAIILVGGVIFSQVSSPPSVDANFQSDALRSPAAVSTETSSLPGENESSASEIPPTRQGLFKSDSALREAPRADATVEKLLARLSLQCVLNIGGQPIAYIKVKGRDLAGYHVGDTIDDTFQVTHIDVASQSIEILVANQKEVLRL